MPYKNSRPTSKKRGRPASRTKKSTPKTQKANNKIKIKSHNQSVAILLFSFSILLLCLIIVPGENIWNTIHTFIWGVFANAAIFWPFLLMYVSFIISKEDLNDNASIKIWLSIIVIILVCTAFYVFSSNRHNLNNPYWSQLRELYLIGSDETIPLVHKGAGFFSGLLGIPLVYALGNVGACIVTIILLFGSIMLLTGVTLLQFFRFVFKPIKKKNEYNTEITEKERPNKPIKKAKAKNVKIDIPIDDMPNHPVRSIPNDKETATNDKLEKLKNVLSKTNKSNDNSADIAAETFMKKNSEIENNLINEPESSLNANEYTNNDVTNNKYLFPPITLLEKSKNAKKDDIQNELKTSGQMLVDTLKSFNVSTKIIDISRGPAVTRYELQPAAGVKISKITNLADDISLNLAASGVRIEAPIPGKAAVGVEVPNKVVNVVRMRELISSHEFYNSNGKLTVILGRDIAGNVSIADLSKMPHLLIAGSTGSGKSVCINSFIISLLYKSSPDDVRLLMIDPKVVELGIYNGIPHLLVPVVTDPRKAAGSLNWAVTEMLKRYKIFADNNVRDLTSYNSMVSQKKKANEPCLDKDGNELETMPQIVIIIDELADLMMAAPHEVEDSICRLAQMARAAGMHLVIATQRPSVDVITGIIKANIPSRIALAVSSQVDSRTILDMSGAEKLLGRGDMLFSPVGAQKPVRIQGCYVTDKEISSVIDFIKNSQETDYDENIIEEIEKNAVPEKESEPSENTNTDPMLNEAIKCVVEAGQASTSLLQRRLRLGYARAGRLIDEMEKMGIVGPHEGSKPRQLLITYQQFLEMNMQKSDTE